MTGTVTRPGSAPTSWPRGVRGLRLAVTASDPGLGRLRSAATTVVVLAVTAAVVLGGAVLLGGPVTAAVTGVVVAFVSSIAARDGSLVSHAVTAGWTAVAVAAVSVVSAFVGGAGSPRGIAVFVALGVAVVFLQRLGPRGFAPGMAGFITFLATSLTGLTPSGLPLAVGGAALAAGLVVGTRWLLRTRRPERVARQALDAVETRAALVVAAFAAVLRETEGDRARQRARRRLASLRRTAAVADDRLADTDTPALDGIDNPALGVRVFDLRLGLEHLASLVDGDRLDEGPTVPGSPERCELADTYDEVARALLAPRGSTGRWDHADALLGRRPADGLERVQRTLARTVGEWRRPPDRLDEERADDDEAGEETSGGGGATPISDSVRRAVQVGLAVALAAVVGQTVSSSQWFFAVVIAFVVVATTSSRGGVLSEGWQRTLGTLVGVVVGVGLAALLGGAAVPTVVLLAVCLFGALYVAGTSSAALMIFITVAIALVYDFVGRPTVNGLLMRLAETAVGAAIGITVSFLVLPTRTRTGFTDATARFLRALRRVVDQSVEVLTCSGTAGAAVQTVDEGDARELRDAYAGVEAAAGPLTDGIAGVLDRTGHRDDLRVVGSCDHHARLLLRLARRHGAVAGDDDDAAQALREAAEHVSGRIDALARRFDRQLDDDGGADVADDPDEHARVAHALDEAARRLGEGSGDESVSAVDAAGAHPDATRVACGDVLEAVGGRLRAVDRALTDMAGDGEPARR